MFGPDYGAGCPSCSAIADGFNGFEVHLKNHDVMLWAASRAPLAKLQEYKKRMGWTFPWASSTDGEFNSDFSASFTEEEQRKGIDYNYEQEEPVAPISSRSTSDGASKFAAMCGTDVNTYIRERAASQSQSLISNTSSSAPPGAANAGEHRLLACWFRLPAETNFIF